MTGKKSPKPALRSKQVKVDKRPAAASSSTFSTTSGPSTTEVGVGSLSASFISKVGITSAMRDGSGNAGIVWGQAVKGKQMAKAWAEDLEAFIEAVAAHRLYERDMDPTPI